jgi:hypothetical protein
MAMPTPRPNVAADPNLWFRRRYDEVTFEENGGTTLVTGRTVFPTFQARELYTAAGAERGLAECHERLDELLAALASRPREGQRQ